MALRDSAIVGFAETKIVTRGEEDVWSLGADILEQILDRTGYEKGEIDGLCLSASMTGASNPFWAQTTADQLGLELDFCQSVDIGGCSPSATVARAAAALSAGLCTTILCLFADTAVRESHLKLRSYSEDWAAPVGNLGPTVPFAFLTKHYEAQFGLDFAALGKLAVTQRDHALLNDLACEKLRKPITIDDYLSSRIINDPLRLLDSVMPCDGASGLLMTTRRRAEQRGFTTCAFPIGYGERTNYQAGQPIIDPTESGHKVAGARAFAMAGLTPADIGSFHPYDDFIIAIMLQLEMLGFCGRGQGCDYIAATDFHFDGDLPLNTGGGQISAGQAGLAGGGTNLIEGVRQIFGAGGARQVRKRDHALVTGIGGIPYCRNWNSSTVLILGGNG